MVDPQASILQNEADMRGIYWKNLREINEFAHMNRISSASKSHGQQTVNLVRLQTHSSDAKADSAESERMAAHDGARHLTARTVATTRQIEQDVLLTMRVLGDAADEVHAKVGESLSNVARIREATQELTSMSDAAKIASTSLAAITVDFEQSNRAIVRHVNEASRFASEARASAACVTERMKELVEAVNSIARVVELISGIARRTNMLALNATIEAARAGSAGRGFGVVAAEVKNLANGVQRATSEIAAKIEELQRVSTQSVTAANAIAGTVGEVEPALDLIRQSVAAQAESNIVVSRRANENAHFAESVAQNAAKVQKLAEVAAQATDAAGSAGNNMAAALERLTERSIVFLRHRDIGNRRRHVRVPIEMDGNLHHQGKVYPLKIFDISMGGALVHIGKVELPSGSWGKLQIDGIGTMDVTVLSTSFHGVHLRFDTIADQSLQCIEEIIDRVHAEAMPVIRLAQAAAAEIRAGFEAALARGEAKIEDFITIDYRQVPGTNPIQYVTNATPIYDRLLPPILAKYVPQVEVCLFFLAGDKNAYFPVHQPKYSQPQRAGDYEWNDLNCRNRRIMERSQTLAAVRNIETFYISLYIRDMADGRKIPAKIIAAPINIGDHHWGNVVVGVPFK